MDFVRIRFAKGLCLIALLVFASPVLAGDKAGFPSEQACHFMDSMPNFHLAKNGNYHQEEGLSEYNCGTYYWEIVGDPPNNLAYYASGTPTTVEQMELSLNINDPSDGVLTWTLQDFAESAAVLYKQVFKAKLTKVIRSAILKEKSGQWVRGPYTIILKKNVWPRGGRDLSFMIQVTGYTSDTPP